MKMIRLFVLLTFFTGVIYPLTVTLVGKTIFTTKASGSILYKDNAPIGSSLLAQNFSEDGFFHPRPSAGNYETVAGSASQLSPASMKFRQQFESYKSREPLAAEDMWTTSGSGLDPHISPESASAQVQRVSSARNLSKEVLDNLVKKHIEEPFIGIWGRARVNVLELNMELLKVLDGNSRTAPQ